MALNTQEYHEPFICPFHGCCTDKGWCWECAVETYGYDEAKRIHKGKGEIMALNITKGDWKLLEGVKPEYNGHVIVSVEYGVNLAYAETFDVDPVEAEANAHLIAQSPRMAEWIIRVTKQNFVTFPEDRAEAREIVTELGGI